MKAINQNRVLKFTVEFQVQHDASMDVADTISDHLAEVVDRCELDEVITGEVTRCTLNLLSDEEACP